MEGSRAGWVAYDGAMAMADKKFGHFGWLLVSLVSLLALTPFADVLELEIPQSRLFSTVVLLVGMYSLRRNPWMFRVRIEDGRVWLGTQGGAASVEPGAEHASMANVPDPRIHEIRRLGTLRYVGTEGGLLVMAAR